MAIGLPVVVTHKAIRRTLIGKVEGDVDNAGEYASTLSTDWANAWIRHAAYFSRVGLAERYAGVINSLA
ncbi:hypothetical protein [Alteromonas macleodii]|uniref:hypothetical protein n=1 Tax=Alteromonas macleodii TaxID=28108 RepID=UPI00313D7F0D